MDTFVAVMLAAAFTAAGGISLRKLRDRRIAGYERRLADRLAAGEDRFFEELRQLEAYDPRRRSHLANALIDLTSIACMFVFLVMMLLRSGT